MRTVDRPACGRTTLNPDGSVTLWNCLLQAWVTGSRFDDRVLAKMNDQERCRVLRHVAHSSDRQRERSA